MDMVIRNKNSPLVQHESMGNQEKFLSVSICFTLCTNALSLVVDLIIIS